MNGGCALSAADCIRFEAAHQEEAVELVDVVRRLHQLGGEVTEADDRFGVPACEGVVPGHLAACAGPLTSSVQTGFV